MRERGMHVNCRFYELRLPLWSYKTGAWALWSLHRNRSSLFHLYFNLSLSQSLYTKCIETRYISSVLPCSLSPKHNTPSLNHSLSHLLAPYVQLYCFQKVLFYSKINQDFVCLIFFLFYFLNYLHHIYLLISTSSVLNPFQSPLNLYPFSIYFQCPFFSNVFS